MYENKAFIRDCKNCFPFKNQNFIKKQVGCQARDANRPQVSFINGAQPNPIIFG